MPTFSLPKRVLAEAFNDGGHREPGRVVSNLIKWWNENRRGLGADADHLAAYISTPEGWWRNVLWDDPTEYQLSWFEKDKSSARLEDLIIEFRVLRTVDGQSRSSPTAALESYLVIEPDDARAWSVRAIKEVRCHISRVSQGADAFELAARL